MLAKLREEVVELEAEIHAGDTARARQELGDVLFVCANLARALEIDPEDALRTANDKFVRRFRSLEDALAATGRSPATSNLAEYGRPLGPGESRRAGLGDGGARRPQPRVTAAGRNCSKRPRRLRVEPSARRRTAPSASWRAVIRPCR